MGKWNYQGRDDLDDNPSRGERRIKRPSWKGTSRSKETKIRRVDEQGAPDLRVRQDISAGRSG